MKNKIFCFFILAVAVGFSLMSFDNCKTIQEVIIKFPPFLQEPDTNIYNNYTFDPLLYNSIRFVTPTDVEYEELLLKNNGMYNYSKFILSKEEFLQRSYLKKTPFIEFSGVYCVKKDSVLIYEDLSIKNPDALKNLGDSIKYLPNEPIQRLFFPFYRRIIYPRSIVEESKIPDNVNAFIISLDGRTLTGIENNLSGGIIPKTFNACSNFNNILSQIFHIKNDYPNLSSFEE